MQALPDGLAVEIERDVDRGSEEGGGVVRLLGLELEASEDLGDLDVNRAGGWIAQGSSQIGAEGVDTGVGGVRDGGSHPGAVADQAFELHGDFGVVSDGERKLAEFDAVEPGAQDGALGEEGVKGGVDSVAGGMEKVLIDAGGERGLGDASEEVLEEFEDGAGGEAEGPGRLPSFWTGDSSLQVAALVDGGAGGLGVEEIGIEREDGFVGGEADAGDAEGSFEADGPEDGGAGGSQGSHSRISCSRRSMSD